MWVSWWTKRSLVRFFSGFLPFSLAINFIRPFLHTHLNYYVSFNFTGPYDGVTGVVGRLANHGPSILGNQSHFFYFIGVFCSLILSSCLQFSLGLRSTLWGGVSTTFGQIKNNHFLFFHALCFGRCLGTIEIVTNTQVLRDDRGGPVVIILASGSEVREFKPGRGR